VCVVLNTVYLILHIRLVQLIGNIGSWIPDLLSEDQYCEIPDQDFQEPVAPVTKFNPQFHRL